MRQTADNTLKGFVVRVRLNRIWNNVAVLVMGCMLSATGMVWSSQNPSGPFVPPEPVLTLEEVTVNRIVENPSGGVAVSLALPALPSVAELSAFRGLMEPLLPVAPDSTESERAALASSLNAWLARTVTDDFSQLETFATNHPDSVWTPSLLLNLGRYYYHTGYFGKALDAWESCWEKTRTMESPEAIGIADASAAELAVMLARVGRKAELTDLLAAVSERTFQGSTLVLIDRAREGLWKMEHRPEVSFRCGPYALNLIHTYLNGEAPGDFLEAIASPPEGFSMVELRGFAQSGLNSSYQVAKRNAGAPLILPSVVHWTLGHYGALIREQDGTILLQDPTFGNDTWMTPSAIDAESSGYFLVPVGALPQGWEPVDDATAAMIFGRGHTGNSDNDDTSECSHQKGGGCGTRKGMAGYSFHTMLASLHISDIPVSYPVARGPDVEFKVSYNMRENGQPSTMQFTNFSPLWVNRWVSYLEDNPAQLAADIKVILPGGGAETHTGYNSTTQSFSKNRRWDTVLVRIDDNIYERRHSNGSKEVYSQAIGMTGPARKVFLKQIVDSQGNAVTLNYDTEPGFESRIKSVSDAAGLTSTFFYNETGAPYLVTAIADPFGRSATFTYQTVAGALRLTKITDTIGIESSFEHNSSGLITALTTPYGRTTFSFGNPGSHYGLIRWIEATDPEGSKERLEYHLGFHTTGVSSSVPSSQVPTVTGLTFQNADMDDRNSFYWDKKAWASAPGDYSKAHLYHWLQIDGADRASGILESEKPAFENRVWYRYPGQPSNASRNIGSSPQPSVIARRIEDGQGGFTTEVTHRAYNDLGNITQMIDPAGRETVFEYAANNMDLTAVKQRVGGTLQTIQSFTYNPAYPAHLPATVTDAAGQTTTFTYNTHGQVATITNALNETTTYAYGPAQNVPPGRLWKVTGPVAGATVTLTYDGFERVRTVTDFAGHTTTYDYDTFDRVTLITYPDATSEQFVYERFDLHGHKDRNGRWTRTWHNSLRQPVLTADALGQMIQFQWCKCGDLKKLIDAKGQITFWKHDAQGRIYEKEYADGRKESLSYEPLSGRLSALTDAKGQIKTFRYFTDGALRAREYSNLASGTAPTADVSFTYDGDFGRLLAMTDGTGTTEYTYRSIGQLGALLPATIDGPLSATSDQITFTYDALGRVKTRNIGASGNENLITWNYDSLGRIASVINNLGTFGHSYVNETTRLSEIAYPNGQKTAFGYFPASCDNRLETIHHTGSNPTDTISRFDYSYSPDGTITTWQRQFGAAPATRYTFGYDRANQLTVATLAEAANPAAVIKRHSYQYDPAGNRTSEQLDGSVNSAAHNSVNELTGTSGGGKLLVTGHTDEPAKVSVNGKVAETDASNSYRAWIDATPGPNTITVQAEDWSPNANTATKSWSINVTGGTTRSFTYDDNGNTLSDGIRTYQWDAEDRLVTITQGTDEYEFIFDGLDRRVAEKVNGTITRRWIWAGSEIAEQRAPDGTTVQRRFFRQGEERLGGSDAGTYFYSRDHLGSIRELTDDTTLIRARYDYDSYGTREKLSGDLDCDFAFTGHFYHSPTSLHLALYRAYDSEAGRWLSRDPIERITAQIAELLPEGPNLYAYVANNPVNHIDPKGTDCMKTSYFGHAYATVWDSQGNQTTFDFSPLEGWRERSGGPPRFSIPYSYTSLTPEQDQRLLNAFRDRVRKQSDQYNPALNNCYQALSRVRDENLGAGRIDHLDRQEDPRFDPFSLLDILFN